MIYQNYLNNESAKARYAKVVENAPGVDVVAHSSASPIKEKFEPLGKYIS